MNGELIFKAIFVQRGSGPNLLDWAYATDENWDSFYSDISSKDGIVKISNTFGKEKFGINVRWNVEEFGYIFITADNGGEFYSPPDEGMSITLNLNYELAKSRVARNRKRSLAHKKEGWIASKELTALYHLSEELFEDATKFKNDELKCGDYSQRALLYAMRVSEMIELEKAQYDIYRNGKRNDFFIGCDARSYFQIDPDLFLEEFPKLFNYATITHYLTSSSYPDFEPTEGDLRFAQREQLIGELRKRNITVEGRPLFYFYKTTTPDWLRTKKYSDLLKYVEKHTKEVVGHYGDQLYAWEVINEAHDWANELKLNPEQIVEVTKLACDVAKATNPKVHRLINNCCPYAEYVQMKKWGDLDAEYRQRTPYQFMKDLVDADVDFTIMGQQMYFPYRDLADIIIYLERLQDFGKPVQITEFGASSGPSEASIKNGSLEISLEPYIWHRPWDEELQAEWYEGIYTLAFSKPWIEAVNLYDFVDPYGWIKNGGILKNTKGDKKLAFQRILELKNKWGI